MADTKRGTRVQNESKEALFKKSTKVDHIGVRHH